MLTARVNDVREERSKKKTRGYIITPRKKEEKKTAYFSLPSHCIFHMIPKFPKVFVFPSLVKVCCVVVTHRIYDRIVLDVR